MSSRKRSRPEDDDPTAPPRPSAASTPPSQQPPAKRVLAPRDMFFEIPLRSQDVRDKSILALDEPAGEHALAMTRVINTPALSGIQRASLTVLLTILNDYFPGDPVTTEFTRSVAYTTETDDIALAVLADKVDKGLVAFHAKGGPHDSPVATPAPSIAQPSSSGSDTPDRTPAPSATVPTPSSSTTAITKRGCFSKKSALSRRSQKIKTACKARDGDICRLCNVPDCLSAHIIPFSIRGSKNLDLWSFIAMFRGTSDTASLKAAALDPDPDEADNLMNVMQLCRNCHRLLDAPRVSLVPQILEDPASIFPYDPRAVTQYDVVAEFPAGLATAVIFVMQDDGESKRMRPGQVFTLRTADPVTLPLPHPLLLQLHVLCSRMVVLRAAAGYPVLLDDDSDDDTVYDLLGVGEEPKCFVQLGRPKGEEARDPAVVMLEKDQRKREQELLLMKIKGRGAAGKGVGVL